MPQGPNLDGNPFGFPGWGSAIGRGFGDALSAGWNAYQQDKDRKEASRRFDETLKQRSDLATLADQIKLNQVLYGYQGKVDTANIGADARRDVATTGAKNRIDVQNLRSDSAQNVAEINAGARYYAANKGFDAATARVAAARDIAKNSQFTANRRIDAAIQMKQAELDLAGKQGDANRTAAAQRSLMALYGRLHSGISGVLGGDDTDVDSFLNTTLGEDSPPSVTPSTITSPGAGPTPTPGPTSTSFRLVNPPKPPGPPASLAGPSPASTTPPPALSVPGTGNTAPPAINALASVAPPPGASGPTASGTVTPGATAPPLTPPPPPGPPSLAGPRLAPTGPPAKNRKLSLVKPTPSDLAPQPGPMFAGASGDVGGGGVSPANDASGPARDTPRLGTGMPVAPQGPDKKTVTRAQLNAFAVKTRRTPQQAEGYARTNGWTIVEQ
jgi:hypothetical protein